MKCSAGSPPGTTCSGAWAYAMPREQRGQAYFGRRVTSTRNWAGITSSRSDTSSLVLIISPQPHGHKVLAGSFTRSMRGRCGGKLPRLRAGLRGSSVPLAALCAASALLRRLKHAIRQFDIRQRQVELVGRQLFGAFAELLALRLARDLLQPPIGLPRTSASCASTSARRAPRRAFSRARSAGSMAQSESRNPIMASKNRRFPGYSSVIRQAADAVPALAGPTANPSPRTAPPTALMTSASPRPAPAARRTGRPPAACEPAPSRPVGRPLTVNKKSSLPLDSRRGAGREP